MSLFTDHIVIFLENPKGLAKEILRLVSDSTRSQDLQGPSYKKNQLDFYKRHQKKMGLQFNNIMYSSIKIFRVVRGKTSINLTTARFLH